jgi:hypothetical protein
VYVEKRENLAYFSADPDISGDDWDDSPWELNAEPPSEWDARVVWVGWGLERTEGPSVDRINAGAAPWLTSSYGEETVYIHAGDSVDEFIAKVEAAGSIAVIIPERPAEQDEPTGPVLPPHAAQVMSIFGFPLGADTSSSLWWAERDGAIRLYADCSDTFAWGTADAEEILERDLPLLRECLHDLQEVEATATLPELFAARKRGTRPMREWMRREPLEVQALFPPDADGAAESIWPAMRAGRKVKRTLYLQRGRSPADGDELVGIVDTGELAAEVVARWNRGDLR